MGQSLGCAGDQRRPRRGLPLMLSPRQTRRVLSFVAEDSGDEVMFDAQDVQHAAMSPPLARAILGSPRAQQQQQQQRRRRKPRRNGDHDRDQDQDHGRDQDRDQRALSYVHDGNNDQAKDHAVSSHGSRQQGQEKQRQEQLRRAFVQHEDVVERIMFFLDVAELSQMAQVCRALSRARWPVVDLRRHLNVSADDLVLIMQRRPMVLLLSNPRQSSNLLAPTVIGCPTLRHLALRRCSLGPEGAEHIALGIVSLYRSVHTLDLSGNSLGDTGVAVIAASLATNVALKHMDLSENAITEAGAAALGGALKKNTSLISLRLSDNELGPTGIKHVAAGLAANPASALRSLDASENSIESQGARFVGDLLKANTSLITICLEDNGIESAGAEHLWAGLLSNTSLQTLQLDSNHIDAEGLAGLQLALQKCKTLQSISLKDNPLGDSGARMIAQCLMNNQCGIQELDLSFTGVQHSGAFFLSHALESNSVLRVLRLRFCKLQDAGASCLGTALQKNKTLERLDLEDCGIQAAGAVQLGISLSSNSGLKVMSLRSNCISDTGAQGLAGGLKSNCTLQSLDLAVKAPSAKHRRRRAEGVIGPKGAQSLGDALRVNKSLGTLHLQGHSVGRQHYLMFAGSRCFVRLVAGEPGMIVSRIRTVTV
eukprot:m.18594 g.18594  ORF g.18594 m.18594 type:complete len:653 (-) comp5752_c0_seq2:466-2424(-)